jgi:hypothetical protein
MVILSDLHLGEGKVDGAWSKREQFRAQQHFDDMVSYLLRRQARAGGRRLKLVLAGDTIDFLVVTHPPRGEQWADRTPKRDYSPTAATALRKLRRVAQEHGPFFRSVSRVRNPTSYLTFVDIRQTGSAPRVLLRRWETEKGRPIRLGPRTLADGKLPTASRVH